MSDNYPEFSSLEFLDQYISEYEKKNCVQLWKRDSRTIEKMKAVCPVKLSGCNSELKYYRITYACKKGGRQFKSKNSGLRKSSTYKDNCPMQIKVSLSEDGTKLKIVKIEEEHNHTLDRELFENMPKQRQLNQEEKTEAIKMLKMNCNKKLVQAYLQEQTGKPIQLNDLKNLRTSSKCSSTDIQNVVNLLLQDDGVARIAVNENDDLLGIYHQTPYMKTCFAAYPELMVLDATYKLNNLDMPLYVLMSINGNNEGEVIAVFLLSEETSDVIRHMMQVFKEHNPGWMNIQTFMTDKDFGEKTVLYDEFPDASHQLCLSHVFKRFRTAITTESMQIDSSQRKIVLEILQNIAFSKSEAEYEESYQKLITLNFPKVTKYYKKNWHCIKHEWVECYKRKYTTFNIRTSNDLESFSQKIKQVCVKCSNLESFFKNFAIVLNSIKLKRRQTVHDMLLKKKVTTFEPNSPDSYLKCLTPFAFELVNERLKKVHDFDITSLEGTQYEVRDKEDHDHMVEILLNCTTCTCSFNVTTNLPCSHIFAVKSMLKIDLFDKNLIHDRFLKTTYFNCYGSKNISEETSTGSQCEFQMIDLKNKIPSSHQKYKIALSKCEKIASIISNFNTNDFRNHCEQLDTLINSWSQRKETVIAESVEQNELIIQHEDPLVTDNDNTIVWEENEDNIIIENVENRNEQPELAGSENEQAESGQIYEEEKVFIRLPVIRKRRGRPKHDLTVVGLKRKK